MYIKDPLLLKLRREFLAVNNRHSRTKLCRGPNVGAVRYNSVLSK